MKSTFIATAVLAFAALGSVNASAMTHQNGEAAAAAAFQPVLSAGIYTRAEVQAEYLNARKAGTLPIHSEVSFAPVAQTASTVTREQIRMEAVMAAYGSAYQAL